MGSSEPIDRGCGLPATDPRRWRRGRTIFRQQHRDRRFRPGNSPARHPGTRHDRTRLCATIRGWKLTRGWVHPQLRLGFEVVGSALLDGLAERDRAILFELSSGDRLIVISIEDLIADRLGQFASGSAPEMLGQARTIFNLHNDLDMAYMERRIRAETAGDHGIEILTNAA